MPAYVVAKMKVHDPEKLREYAKLAPHYVARHGGRYLTRGGDLTCLEETSCTSRVVISVWPDKAAAEAFFSDPDYLEVAELRKAASTMELLIVQDGVEYADAPEPGV